MNRSFSRSVGTSSQQQNVPKYFDILPYPPLKVRVHPVVILTILDANLRREDGQMNVIGTLLGTVSEGNVVDISDCFVDRHSLTDEVRPSSLPIDRRRGDCFSCHRRILSQCWMIDTRHFSFL